MRRIGTFYLGVGLLAITLAAYLPLWDNGFVNYDDEPDITTNPHVLGGLTRSNFAWAWTDTNGKYWQPLTWLSLQLDAELFAPQVDGSLTPLARAMHLENLAWHAASALLLFGLLRRLTGSQWRSFLVAALFALHPLRVESVAWAVERKDVLSVFWGMVTLWAYALYAAKPSWRRYLPVLVPYALTLLAKPMLITLPAALLLLDYWPLRRIAAGRWGWLLVDKVPLAGLAFVVAVLAMVARIFNGSVVPLADIPLSARVANALTAYGWYVAHTVWPANLAILYPHPGRDWSWGATLAGAATLLVLTGLAAWQARRRPYLLVGWLWFVGSLVPVIGLAQGGTQAYADRFTYWPHVGLLVAAVWGLAALLRYCRVPAVISGLAGVLALSCLGAATWVQIGYWHDVGTLWERDLAVTGDDNALCHFDLGKFYLDGGRPDLAEPHLAAAVHGRPTIAPFHYYFGLNLFSLGRVEEAATQFELAWQYYPLYPDAWYHLGLARLRLGQADVAADCFVQALAQRPGWAPALAGRGRAEWQLGQRAEAVRSFEDALRHDRKDADAWRGLGIAYLAEGRSAQAVAALSEAVGLRPDSAEFRSDLGAAFVQGQGPLFH